MMQSQEHEETHVTGHRETHKPGQDKVLELMREQMPEGTNTSQCGYEYERGMVTSELAVGLIPISFIAILLMVITSFMSAHLQAQSVAYAVARNAAVGKAYDASSLDVPGANKADIAVGSEGEYVVVTASVEPSGVLGWLDVRASSTLSVPLEPGVALP